ncbi:MAG: hypothetical protein O3B65_06235, partial [Chloroflexi bacterium]|nr:hypothetical protein [Chloroflexota bacterium]
RIIAESPEGEWHTCTSSHIKRMLSIQKKKSDVLLPVTSNLLEIASFSRLVSPLSIRPLPPDQRYSLLSGDTILLTVLNVSGLARWFERRGWHALVVIPDTEPDLSGVGYVPGIRVEKDGKVAELPLDILTLASHELWMRESLEAVAETIVERVAMTSPGSSLGMIQVSLVNVGESALD